MRHLEPTSRENSEADTADLLHQRPITSFTKVFVGGGKGDLRTGERGRSHYHHPLDTS
jgi:hypothetical protein